MVYFNGTEAQPANQPELQQPASRSAAIRLLATLDSMKTIFASDYILEPLVVAHARDMFCVLSDQAIYQFENEPPASEEWLEKRYERLQRRGPEKEQEQWLNWVVRLPNGELSGYVQATLLPSGAALIAYEFGSKFWRQGIGTISVLAMLQELRLTYSVHTFVAILKVANFRSSGLLTSLGFSKAGSVQFTEYGAEPDEIVMVQLANSLQNAA